MNNLETVLKELQSVQYEIAIIKGCSVNYEKYNSLIQKQKYILRGLSEMAEGRCSTSDFSREKNSKAFSEFVDLLIKLRTAINSEKEDNKKLTALLEKEKILKNTLGIS